MSAKKEKQGEVSLETKLHYWLDSFHCKVQLNPDASIHLHDAITSVYEQCYDEEVMDTLKDFLELTLGLNLLVARNLDELEDFLAEKLHKNPSPGLPKNAKTFLA